MSSTYFFEKPGGFLLSEVYLYTSHYFDSAIRLVEAIPKGSHTELHWVDVSEVDELKKPEVIRWLFQAEIERAVRVGHQSEVDRFLAQMNGTI